MLDCSDMLDSCLFGNWESCLRGCLASCLFACWAPCLLGYVGLLPVRGARVLLVRVFGLLHVRGLGAVLAFGHVGLLLVRALGVLLGLSYWFAVLPGGLLAMTFESLHMLGNRTRAHVRAACRALGCALRGIKRIG